MTSVGIRHFFSAYSLDWSMATSKVSVKFVLERSSQVLDFSSSTPFRTPNFSAFPAVAKVLDTIQLVKEVHPDLLRVSFYRGLTSSIHDLNVSWSPEERQESSEVEVIGI